MQKETYPNILVVGANHRKTGKTTLVEQIIQHFRQDQIIAIKIAAYTDLKDFQARHPENEDLLILEETEANTKADSKRYLNAGAAQSFYIAGIEEKLVKNLPQILNNFKNKPVIIESNWFALHYNPGYILLLKEKSEKQSKSSFLKLKDKADAIIQPGTISEAALIYWRFENGKWNIPGQ